MVGIATCEYLSCGDVTLLVLSTCYSTAVEALLNFLLYRICIRSITGIFLGCFLAFFRGQIWWQRGHRETECMRHFLEIKNVNI